MHDLDGWKDRELELRVLKLNRKRGNVVVSRRVILEDEQKSKRDSLISTLAVIDLLPGGFEVVSSSLSPGISSINGVDYVEVREDRAIFYATVPTQTLEITYQIKSCNRGNFVVPPMFAESMYDRNVKARGLGGKISVTK